MNQNSNIFDRRKNPIEEVPLTESQIVPEPHSVVPQPEPAGDNTNIEISTLNQTEQEEAKVTFPVRMTYYIF